MGDTRLRSVRLPADVDERLVERAAELDRSVSWVIVRAVEQALGSPAGQTSRDSRPWQDSAITSTPAERLRRPSGSPSLARFKGAQNGA